jgi:hypothetical protein
MIGVDRPSPIPPSLVEEPTKGRPQSRIGTIAEAGHYSKPDQQIVVVVGRIVNPEPRRIPDPSFVHQPAAQKELRSPLYRSTN